MGQLFPIGLLPVLPGDTVQHVTSALIRVTPLNTPVMHPTTVRIHHYFVPNRIVFPEWEDFITGGDGFSVSPEIPTLTTDSQKKSILTYLGLPPIPGVQVSALPVRAFNKIFNEFYRDQDLVTSRLEDDITVPRIAWEKDYFSTSRPWTQKGPDVSLPLGGQADVKSTLPAGSNVFVRELDADPENTRFQLESAATAVTVESAAPGTSTLVADLSSATAPAINDFRAAFAIQRYQEARARYGSRFTEYLRYLGINPSDARLQRPEFLGGGSTQINFSEVLQTAPDDSSGGPEETLGIGDMYGHGIAATRSNRYRKFFEEHGYVISCMSIRPKSLYLNGIHRDWLKTTKEDFYQKELANLGQQEVFQAELYAENERDVFGFQDRYHEYRSHPSQVGQDFRDTLNAWHMGRDLQPDVTLNEAFIECDPSDRIFQIGEEIADTLWCMINHKVVARRIVPKRANPRII